MQFLTSSTLFNMLPLLSSTNKIVCWASTMGLSNSKCKVHLAYRPRIRSAIGWLKSSEAKFFWHSATVPSHMWDGTIALCQNNLVYFNPFKPLSLLLRYRVLLSHPLSLSPAIVKLLSFSLITKPRFSLQIAKPLSPSLYRMPIHPHPSPNPFYRFTHLINPTL